MPDLTSHTVRGYAIADMHGWNYSTFKMYRFRNGFLKRRQGGDAYDFADALSANVAKRLMDFGVKAQSACDIANKISPLEAFVNDQPITVYHHGGEMSQFGNPDEDIAVQVPLERFGWELAEFFALDIAEHFGIEASQDAMKRFKLKVSEIRGGAN